MKTNAINYFIHAVSKFVLVIVGVGKVITKSLFKNIVPGMAFKMQYNLNRVTD